MILNETPVKTSRNFNINNIKLENVSVPKDIGSFNNVKILKNYSNIKIEESCNNCDLVYGLGEVLVSQVRKKANKVVKLTLDSKKKMETQIDFEFDGDNSALVENIAIVANENTESTVIIEYKSNESVSAYHNGIINILANENSIVNVVIVNLMNIVSDNFLSVQINEKSNACVNLTTFDFGGRNSITNYYSNLEGDFSDNKINTVYLGKDNQVFDLNYIGELRGKRSNIDIEVQGALGGCAKKHFKGTIDFKKGCKKATGCENESCMLLSDTARSIALPMLLCSEEDVVGNHSSSAGKIGDKELFYIMSRGFERKEAIRLMVRAKFNKILDGIEKEELKEEINREVDKRLN